MLVYRPGLQCVVSAVMRRERVSVYTLCMKVYTRCEFSCDSVKRVGNHALPGCDISALQCGPSRRVFVSKLWISHNRKINIKIHA